MSKTGKHSDNRGNYCRTGPGGFELRKLVRSILDAADFEEALKMTHVAPKRMINPLLCFLCETDEVIRWRAVRGVGITVAAIAERDLESARTIMRRLIWSLNDESGGIGWGAPEAMGEIMAQNEILAREYHRLLISYIDENGNLLDNDELKRGAMWGIDRLAQKRPHLLREWTGPILARLKSPDPVERGLALRTLLFLVKPPNGTIETERPGPFIYPLLGDQSEIRIYQNGSFTEHKISRLASELLDRLGSPAGSTDH